MSKAPIREALFQVMETCAGKPGLFQPANILHEASVLLRKAGHQYDQSALLTLWWDLFRLGVVSPGHNLDNPELPFCHLTERGRRTLQNISRDPANPDGYLAALGAKRPLPPVAKSYIAEAVESYNAACFKAAAVMVGAASESLILGVRDAVVARLSFHSRTPKKGLTDWRAKTVMDSVSAELMPHSNGMTQKLRESFSYYWPAFTQQIRAGRNDAGHPTALDAISADSVHASLLIFPELLTLTHDIIDWISTQMP